MQGRVSARCEMRCIACVASARARVADGLLYIFVIPEDSTADLQKGQSFAIVWQIVRQFAGWTRGDRVGACGEFRRVIRQWYIILNLKGV